MSWSLAVVALIFGLYGWLSSVEAGIGLMNYLPASTLTYFGRQLFKPLWIINNIVLIVGVLDFLYLFSSRLKIIDGLLSQALWFEVGFLILRNLFIAYLLYQPKRLKKILKYNYFRELVLILNWLTPLLLGSFGLLLIHGARFVSSSSFWLLESILVMAFFSSVFSFIYFAVGLTPHRGTSIQSRYANLAFAGSALLILLRQIFNHLSHLQTLPLIVIIILLFLIILTQFILNIIGQERYMWFIISIVSLVGPLVLTTVNLPYLDYQSVLIVHRIASSLHTYVLIGAITAYLTTLCISILIIFKLPANIKA